MHPYRTFTLSPMAAAGCLMAQNPARNSVQNPASNILSGLPNFGIAQRSIFVVYGSNLGPSTISVAPSLPLPNAPGGTSIQVTVGGTSVTAPMVYTLNTQIAAVLPSNTPIGSGTLTVNYNNGSGSTPITVVKSNFGISTVNQTGTGPAAVTFGDYSVVSGSKSAKAGDTLILWGTGLGPITGDDAAAPRPVDLGTAVSVYMGGVQANVVYRGRSAEPGLDQINFVVPSGVTGCAVSVVAQTGNLVQQYDHDGDRFGQRRLFRSLRYFRVRIYSRSWQQGHSERWCDRPAPALDRDQDRRTNYYHQYRLRIGGIREVHGRPDRVDHRPPGPGITWKPHGYELQHESQFRIFRFDDSRTDSDPVCNRLDAGASITVTPPSGSPIVLKPASNSEKGDYSGQVTAIPTGAYTISNGAGGVDVGAFTKNLTLASPVQWTNQTAVAAAPIDRTKPLTLTWTGGDPSTYAFIEGTSAGSTSTASYGATFICIAPIGPGQFTIPSSILLALPPTNTQSLSSFGYLIMGSESNPVQFTAPGLDFGYVLVVGASGGSVTYK